MDFINSSTVETAKALLGKKMVMEADGVRLSGWIVETEAYLGPEDLAAHSFGMKKTPRLRSMYEAGGTVYVYMIHGHHNVNFITKEAGFPQGVLIRAIEPHEGVAVMEARRGRCGFEATNGPGKLCQAMGIDKSHDGSVLGEGPLSLDFPATKIPREIAASARIGIPNKGEWTAAPLRFFVKGNPFVSRQPKRDCVPAEETWDSDER
ncbi:MAG: DNA-3-methyladenine glycosylase [Turicibacter sp.]|nr:DNA-3-methyladenine glycosylase [Turicibacter sp.]